LNWNSLQARSRKNSSLPGLLLMCCLAVLFFSCGIEYEILLEPVASAYQEGDTRGELILPEQPPESLEFFRYYMIYYRIYLSVQQPTGSIDGTEKQRQDINSTLASHYRSIDTNYIANENASTSGVGSTFSNLRYYPLFATSTGSTDDSVAMYNLLSPQTHGNQDVKISFNFLPGNNEPPRMEMVEPNDPTTIHYYYLIRNNESFTAAPPDRLFYLSNELSDTTPTSEVNADVQSTANPQYAYVSLYICAVGINSTFSPIYSRPTHIGIFELPR